MEVAPNIVVDVGPGIYAPAEDSYLLLAAISVKPGERVLEVGTGSGLIALHCAAAGAEVIATDIDPTAVKNALENARRNSLGIAVVRTDLATGLGKGFDAVIFNPPYLSSEGADGLGRSQKLQTVGGKSGAEVSVSFLMQAVGLLNEGGRIYLLTSSESEAGVLAYASGRLRASKIMEKRIFFETLSVYEFRN